MSAGPHEARKKFKRLRALYRFTKPAAPAFRAAENARLRHVAHSFAELRGAAALVETIAYLQDFSGSKAERQALAAARAVLEKHRDATMADHAALNRRIRAAIDQCRQAQAALAGLSLPQSDKPAAALVGKTWRKQRRAARQALAACHEDGDGAHFHALRKTAQVYWMHLSLLRRL